MDISLLARLSDISKKKCCQWMERYVAFSIVIISKLSPRTYTSVSIRISSFYGVV